ncbi:type II toxin-antitoxin system RelE/ParE family toxin, partial [Microcella sp.]|uniref:type II toxin-antitoxin system RelE/ParE family toxin n=1 Tax=Microcella sp. TaxID=1913979 RepID=UPI00299F7CAD
KQRYARLIARALDDITSDPLSIGSRERPELGDGIIARHLSASAKGSGVSDPRHIVFFRIVGPTVDVLRVLHDARDLQSYLDDDELPTFDA